jgi:hypothetical protein
MTPDWSRKFDEPIPLPKGRHLTTLKDAGTYITKLPKAEYEAAEWQAAMEALIPGRYAWRPRDDGADRHHASVEPARRSRVQPRSQRDALGKAETEEGCMTESKDALRSMVGMGHKARR